MNFEAWLKSNFGLSVDDFNNLDNYQKANYSLMFSKLKNSSNPNIISNYQSGISSALDLQGALSSAGVSLTPESTQWLNNSLSTEAVEDERAYNTQMRDTSITSAANQLGSLGLNPASVIQTGGAGIGNTGAVADISKSNPALEKAMNDFNQKAAMTRTIVGLIGGLGSAGILGSSRLLAKKAASVAASSTAHSGLKAIMASGPTKSWNELLQELDY